MNHQIKNKIYKIFYINFVTFVVLVTFIINLTIKLFLKMQLTTNPIKEKIQVDRVHQSHQKKLILFKLFLALNVSAFGQVYDTVKNGYLDGDTYTIAEVTRKQLESEDIKGNRLYWSMSLVARANRKLERYKRALNIVESIPLDSINYEPLYYDIQL